MKTILLLANRKEDALGCAQMLCEDIKANQIYDHKLYFSRMMMGAFKIGLGEPGDDGKLTFKSDKEIVLFPAARIEDLERLKTNKTIIFCKNCMSVTGDSRIKKKRRQAMLDWVSGESEELSIT